MFRPGQLVWGGGQAEGANRDANEHETDYVVRQTRRGHHPPTMGHGLVGLRFRKHLFGHHIQSDVAPTNGDGATSGAPVLRDPTDYKGGPSMGRHLLGGGCYYYPYPQDGDKGWR